MDFRVEFYESEGGECPVRDFLSRLGKSDPKDHAIILAGLAKLRDDKNHREPLTKPIGGGLFELRHVGKLNTRVFWFFQRGRQIILVHCIRNKGQKISKSDLIVATNRMRDWKRRHPR